MEQQQIQQIMYKFGKFVQTYAFQNSIARCKLHLLRLTQKFCVKEAESYCVLHLQKKSQESAMVELTDIYCSDEKSDMRYYTTFILTMINKCAFQIIHYIHPCI